MLRDSPRRSTPFADDLSGCQVCIPLDHGFRFAHEPTRPVKSSRFCGREDDIKELSLRVLFSDGGAFLITGYRGVGKTSFVNEVLFRLHTALTWASAQIGPTKLVDVSLSLPRRIEPAELMHYIVRQLHERLSELNLLQRLPKAVQIDLADAYRRTSFAVTRKSSTGLDVSFGKEAGFDSAAKAILKLPFEFKKTRSLTQEDSFLGYDEKSAEHDIIRLSRAITRGYRSEGNLVLRLFRFVLGRKVVPVKLKLLFVFDELDKLELEPPPETQATVGDDAGARRISGPPQSSLDAILKTLKTLFTTSGITFLFVAGKDLYDKWLDDVGKGDSVYESVFSYDKYLPCIWNDVSALCAPLTDTRPLSQPECELCDSERAIKSRFCSRCGKYLHSLRAAKDAYDAFVKYLSFRGRGIPRRILRSFNRAVRWNDERPVLGFTKKELGVHQAYAELWDLLRQCGTRILPRAFDDSSDAKHDGRRLATFYTIDWMLKRGAEPFTVEDVLQWTSALDGKLLRRELVTDQFIIEIIRLLIKGDFLEEVKGPRDHAQKIVAGAEDVRVEAIGNTSLAQYRVTSRRLTELEGEESEEADSLPNKPPQEERCGDYQLEAVIGMGGMGRVYRGTQIFTGKVVAIKILRTTEHSNDEVRRRFLREVEIMRVLRHPNIVRFHDSGDDHGRLYAAMEFVDGLTLTDVLDRQGSLSLPVASSIAVAVLDALEYLHEHGFIRNDVKPSNIMVSSSGRVCLIDFGTTRGTQEATILTGSGVIVGTMGYMAPEQFERSKGFDHRADIFAFGVVLYEMLTGKKPFTGEDAPSQIHSVLFESPTSPSRSGAVPDDLSKVVMKCLAKSPESRFQNIAEIRAALLACNLDRANLGTFMREVSEKAKIRHERQTATTFHPSLRSEDSLIMRREDIDGLPVEFSLHVNADSRQFPIGSQTQMFHPVSVQAFLQVNDPDSSGVMTFEFDKSRIKIGRHGDNDVVLESPAVSRFHAEIIRNQDGYWIEDLDSTEGTKLDGSKVSGQQRLMNNARITIGGFEIVFSTEFRRDGAGRPPRTTTAEFAPEFRPK